MPDDWNNFERTNTQSDLDIELLKKEVGQLFPFYDMKSDYKTAAFFCRIDEETLEEKFDSLRKSLSDKGYIPMLRHEKGEHVIYILKKKGRKEKPIWINIFLLAATVVTATLTGSILYMEEFDIWNDSFSGLMPNILEVFNIENLFFGAALFALPLMSILIVHEMGHYYISRKHGIRTSLPFFMPIPPILPSFNIGTFGALISSRDPMPDKKALFDVGISGPLAGFIVALPVTAIGILNSSPATTTEPITGEVMLGGSILFTILANFLLDIPAGVPINLSLTAFAGWVGLLITSINLLPAGQLDGGHIFRAFLGEKQKYAGWIAIIIMIFTGWWFFAIIIVFMMGMMHPPPLNDSTKLDLKRKLLFLVALTILILCYIPYPIYISG
jgi:Zn-dependent protease